MRKAITSSIIISIAIVAIIGTSALAAPSTPPPGGYTGGIFSYYFKNIIEGSGSITGTTSGGVCPIGQVIRGFSTSAGTYGLPICVNPTADNGSASSFTGGLVGTSNYIPKYTSTGTGIVTSQIFDDGTNIGIGTAVPGEKLDISGGSIRTTNQFISTISPGTAPLIVSSDTLNTNLNADLLDGNDSTYFAPASTTVTIGSNQTITGSKVFNSDILVNGLTIGLGGGQLSTNTALGASALASNTTSEFNTAIGNNALALSTAGWWNTAIGHSALSSNTTGSFNTAIGGDALGQNISGINNIAVGNSSLYSNITGQDNAGFGRESLRNNVSGTANTAIGPYALYSNTTGIGNTALGNGAFSSVISSWDSVGIGISAGQNLISGGNNIAIGAYTNFASTGASDQLNIGNWIYGNAGNIGIGTGTNLSAKLTVDGDIRITGGSPGSGLVLTSDATGLASWQSPVVSGITGGQSNRVARWITSTSLGTGAIYDDGVNVGIGTATPGGKFEVWDGGMSIFHGRNLNLGVGAYATNYLATGINNFGIGNFSLASITTASNNVALGGVSLAANSVGNYNIGIGERALQNSTGNSNTAIGANAGNTLTSGDNNIFLGYNVQPNISTTSSNQLNIGNWIYGNAGNIGIGTATPGVGAKLDIAGRIKITDGSQGSGKVLYGDGNGLASWGDLPADLPVGTVMAFNSVSCPAGWAIADGTSGTPDLRGEFIRGLDSGRGVDTGRVLGSWQSDIFGSHQHMEANVANSGTTTADTIPRPVWGQALTTATTSGQHQEILVDAAARAAEGDERHYLTSSTGGTETRPRNVALLYCIKISTYSAPAPQTWYNTTSSPSGNLALATTGNVGVGTTTPTEKLEIAGKIKVVDGSQGTGLVLTSDGNGVGTWQIAPGDLPIGTVMAFNSLSCPAGWAVADGTNGTIDLRGEFVRGLDSGRGVDTGRVLGTAQSGSIYYGFPEASAGWNMSELSRPTLTNLGWEPITGTRTITYRGAAGGVTANASYSLTNAEGAMVRPRNVALLYCMKISVAPGSLSNSGTWVNVSGTSTGHVALGTSGNVGVGTTTPTEKLEVQGSIKVVDGNQGTGKVLISDANGKATWQEMPGDLPVGSIMSFNGASCPAGWAIANGVGGTPDLRGEFIRGLDSGRGVDTGRVLGSYQRGSLIMSNVTAGTDFRVFTLQADGSIANTLGFDSMSGNLSPTATYRWNQVAGSQGVWGVGSSDGNYVGATRPRNVALLYCMKVSAAPATASNSVTWMNVDGTSSGRVALATTGNVGIGTAAPTTKLEVIGDGGNTIDSRFTGRMEIDSAQSPGIWYNRNGDAAVFAGREESLVPNQAWGIWTASGGWNTFNVYKNGNIKTGPFYFDGNDDTWMRLRDSDGGTYKDLAVGQLYASTNVYGGAFYYNSDESLKTNIEKIYSPIEKILKLNGYTFDWKGSGKADIGVIAQEVEQVFPELVSTNPETGLKSVQYGNLVAPIIEALHELVAQVKSLYSITEEQNTRINNLERENAELKARLDAIEIRLAQ